MVPPLSILDPFLLQGHAVVLVSAVHLVSKEDVVFVYTKEELRPEKYRGKAPSCSTSICPYAYQEPVTAMH